MDTTALKWQTRKGHVRVASFEKHKRCVSSGERRDFLSALL